MYKARKTRRARKSNIAIKMILLVMIITACVLTIGARWNGRDVEEINPVAVDTTAEPQTQVVVLPTQAPATSTPAPVATAAPVAAAEPVETFPCMVNGYDSGLGPYHCERTKSPVSVEPDTVGHVADYSAFATSGWFVKHDHTVDMLDNSQVHEVPLFGASLPHYGDSMMRSEDQGKQGVELARTLYAYVLRNEGSAWNLAVERYDEDVHVLVGYIWTGEEADQYWSVWANHKGGYYTLCYVEGKAPVVEVPVTPVQPVDPVDPTPTTPPTDVDPEPVWEDPTTPPPATPTPTEQPWDPIFNDDVDPEPVWEDPTTPPPATPTPTEEPWNPIFNDNVDPEPVWENTNVDPEPVWEPVTPPSSAPVPATQDDWDPIFNDSPAAPATSAAPVVEATPAANVDPEPVWDSANVGSSNGSDASADEGWDPIFN